jgi:hypothetical protein
MIAIMQSRWMVVALAVAGCGDNRLAHPDGIQSGERLRATFLADAEGARQFQTFHDRELGVDCWFRGDPPRCLPDVATTSLYRDAACEEPLYARLPPTGECATLPRFIGIADPDGCGEHSRIWELGLRTARDTFFVFDASTDECRSLPASQEYEYYAAADELPIDGFVAGRREIVGRGQVREQVIAGDDGSRRPAGLFDAELDSSCWFEPELATCLPDFVWQSYRVDDACATPIGGWSDSGCYPVPAYTGRITWDDDETTLHLHELGTDVAPSVLYTGPDASECAPVEPTPGTQYYLAGPAIDAGRLAPLERIVGDARRLQGAYITSPDGLRHFDWTLRDRELARDCYPYPTGPERWHCLPSLPSVLDYFFDDAACTQPIELIEITADSPDGPAIAWQPAGPCASHARLRERGPEIPSGTIYSMSDACTREIWDTALVRRYASGPELPLDDYVELTLVTE